jgi:hypothetical protein
MNFNTPSGVSNNNKQIEDNQENKPESLSKRLTFPSFSTKNNFQPSLFPNTASQPSSSSIFPTSSFLSSQNQQPFSQQQTLATNPFTKIVKQKIESNLTTTTTPIINEAEKDDFINRQSESYFQSIFLELTRDIATKYIHVHRSIANEINDKLMEAVVKKQLTLMRKNQ